MTLEQAYVETVKPVVVGRRMDAQWFADALTLAQADEARLARVRQQAAARERMRRGARVLRPAVARLSDVDLDTAWRAALRGDSAVLEARVLPAVRATPKRARTGTPWRTEGWLRSGRKAR